MVLYNMEFLVSHPREYGKYGLYIRSVIYGIAYRQNRTTRTSAHPVSENADTLEWRSGDVDI
jgi:hypothetical protein